MARQALPPIPDNTYSTPSSAVLRQDGTMGPQPKKPPAGPDCQHISERFVEEAIHKKSLRKPCIVALELFRHFVRIIAIIQCMQYWVRGRNDIHDIASTHPESGAEVC